MAEYRFDDAIKAGVSLSDINAEASKRIGYKYTDAKKAGVSDEDINKELRKRYLAQKEPAKKEEDSSITGAFTRAASKEILPTAAGVAGFGAGAETGAMLAAPVAALSGPLAPAVEAVGVIGGGIAGAVGASAFTHKAQDLALEQIPEEIKKKLSLDKVQEEKDRTQHPYAKFLGELFPGLVAFRPGKLTSIPVGTKSISPMAQRTALGTISGGQEAYRESKEGQGFDPIKIGSASLVGAISTKQTTVGKKLYIGGAEASKATIQFANDTSTSIKKIFSPSSVSEQSKVAAGSFREYAAKFAREEEIAHRNLKQFSDDMNKLPDADRLDFIHRIESGQAQNTPELQKISDSLRSLLDDRAGKLKQAGILDTFIDDYFPHLWKDPQKAAQTFYDYHKSLEGAKGFTKKRTIPTVQEGLNKGLELVTTNPIDNTLMRIRQMDRALMGDSIFKDLKAQKLAKFVRLGDRVPVGWERINDKIANVSRYAPKEKGIVLHGNYVAPKEVTRLINNYLSPGLRGNTFYDAFRGVGNIMNMVQLGTSFFHLGFTTLDAMVSKTALGAKQISQGRPIKGAISILKGISPSTPVENFLKGRKLKQEYYNPGSQGQEIGAIVDALIKAGGRTTMDSFYKTSAAANMWEAFRQGKVVKGTAWAIPAAIEQISKPIMEHIVPNQKLGVFYDMAKNELERNPNMTASEVREVLGKGWDSIDNRLGEMVYDNLFWNKTLKDLSMASVRSVGWNLGTIREIAGGVKDVPISLLNTLEGKGITDRTAYIAALPFTVGMMGAITGYMMGQPPKELKDYFFPKTGRILPNGDEERISLPSYLKDIYEYKEHPFSTIASKVHPLITTIIDMVNNEDYYGAEIRNPDDPFVKQINDVLTHVASSYKPFSLSTYERFRTQGISKQEAGTRALFGAQQAPASIQMSDEKKRTMERLKRIPHIKKRFRELAREQQKQTLYRDITE